MSSASNKTMTVKVPITFQRWRGRKRVVTPDGIELKPSPEREIDNALVKAIARAHRWQRMLEGGEYATLRELATAERINPSYVSRVLRLTLLSPTLVENALNGTQAVTLDFQSLSKPFSADWNEQARLLERSSSTA
ncbi:hypothetical protein RDV64_17435 [Acuticoccus sp. MNP-M23]|uniref:hypothetical protein n=1 Tax=Acuticoccus sp. MNP-M23 TaxID=3072793 RepID=UPI00281628B6|nr:hypothetical protein [Acuticoccus sp. MNP-M23]WMS41834.1 hypothetical protein RDV64_17435 [Acuticoccus sp. MNP-M23]